MRLLRLADPAAEILTRRLPGLRSFSSMEDIETSLRQLLPSAAGAKYPALPEGRKASAVLVPLLKESGEWKLLFTERGEQLADHRGQVAFPGGRAEAEDSGPLETALREACEELGIPPERVSPIGTLKDIDTSTCFRIWPVAGILDWPIRLEPAFPEVREIFLVPLQWLMEPGRLERRPVGGTAGGRSSLFFTPYDGHIIWGATAKITHQLITILQKERSG
jgi:8-oxo-dGTP pyrophosphatase MutT (NUDIX family)